ncbi:MAG TPA: DUF4157 domain-containing protein [Kofleriaceae bacterium]|jgi:O-acetyl-ADP-ribose deacetylase (regulator of RNase III)
MSKELARWGEGFARAEPPEVEVKPAKRKPAPGRTTLVASPLPRGLLDELEDALGADLSTVSLRASEAPRQFGAFATTRGEEIEVLPESLAPDTAQGRALIAHEVIHVLQQRAGRVFATGHIAGAAANTDSRLEGEAHDLGARAAAGQLVRVPGIGARPAASGPIQCAVGANLIKGDPVQVTLPPEGEEAPRVVPGVIAAPYKSGYDVTIEGVDEVAETRFFLVRDLDYTDGHDYGGRRTELAAHLVLGTPRSMKAAADVPPPKNIKAKKYTKGQQEGIDARTAILALPPELRAELALDLKPQELDAIRRGAEATAGKGQEIFPDVPEARAMTEIQGTVVVPPGMGSVTFFPKSGVAVPPGRGGWEGDAARPLLELEVYQFGERRYDGTSKELAAALDALLAEKNKAKKEGTKKAKLEPTAAALSVRLQPRSDKAKVTIGGGEVEGTVKWSRDVAAPMQLTWGSETFPIKLSKIVSEQLLCRDDYDLHYRVTRTEAGAQLTAEMAKEGGGGGGGGFATTRTDLALPDSYCWFGPQPKEGAKAVVATLDPARWRGTYDQGIARGDEMLVFDKEKGEADTFRRTNAPQGSAVLYFKRMQRQLRWFGDPREGAMLGLRKPDYGGAFTDTMAAKDVARDMEGVAQRVDEIAYDGVMRDVRDAISVWRMDGTAPAPRLFDHRDSAKGGLVPDDKETWKLDQQKKMKGRGVDWAPDPDADGQGEWQQGDKPLRGKPDGWESRKNPNDRATMMEGASASAETRKAQGDGGLGAGAAYPRQEWCHLVGHGDGGPEHDANLIAGTHYANTEQLALETAVRKLRRVGGKRIRVRLKVTAYADPDAPNVAVVIRYKVELERVGDRGDGKPKEEASKKASRKRKEAPLPEEAAETVKVFDHVFHGQSESFDRNEFEIATQTLWNAGVQQLQTWWPKDEFEAPADDESELADEGLGLSGFDDAFDAGVVHEFATPGGLGPAGGKNVVARHTLGDGNCSFNALALSLMGLVRERRVHGPTVAARLGVDVDLVAELAAQSAHAFTDAAAALQIQTGLARPMRTRAIAILRDQPARLVTVCQDLLAYAREQAFSRNGGPDVDHQATDLFDDPAYPLHERVNEEIALFTDEVPDAGLVGELDIDTWDGVWDAHGDTLRAWFTPTGAGLHCDHMDGEAVYAGAVELAALADLLGIQVVMFNGANHDAPVVGGRGAGTAQIQIGDGGGVPPRFTADEVQFLMGHELIDGGVAPLNDGQQHDVHFRVVDAETLTGMFDAPDAPLLVKFRALRAENYAFEDAAPVFAGVWNHGHHWSAVNGENGGYDLGNDDALGDDMRHDLADDDAAPLAPGPAARTDPKSDPKKDAPATERSGKGDPFALATKLGTPVPSKPMKGSPIGGVPTVNAFHMFGGGKGPKSPIRPFDIKAVFPPFDPKVHRVGLVNAAQAGLDGGGGIDKAIHDVAGWKELNQETATAAKGAGLVKPKAGDALASGPAGLGKQGVHAVIHAIGPSKHNHEKLDLLATCCDNILAQARVANVNVLVMCAVSSALFGYGGTAEPLIIKTLGELLAGKYKGQLVALVLNNFPIVASTAVIAPPLHALPSVDGSQSKVVEPSVEDESHKRAKPTPPPPPPL